MEADYSEKLIQRMPHIWITVLKARGGRIDDTKLTTEIIVCLNLLTSRKRKITVYNLVFKPILTYGCENWT